MTPWAPTARAGARAGHATQQKSHWRARPVEEPAAAKAAATVVSAEAGRSSAASIARPVQSEASHGQSRKQKSYSSDWHEQSSKHGHRVRSAASSHGGSSVRSSGSSDDANWRADNGSRGRRTGNAEVAKSQSGASTGYSTPHGAMAPEWALLEPAPEPRGPFLFKVAGFEKRTAEEQEDHNRWGDGYDFIPAKCEDMNLMGMASDYELFGSACSDHLSEPQEPPLQRRGQAVLVRGLPVDLCTAPLMQVVLEQAGLRGQVSDCIVQMGECGTDLLLWLPDRQLADYVVWHFHGCYFSHSHVPVFACLVETGAFPEACADIALSLAERALEQLLMPPEEWPRDHDGNEIHAMSRLEPVQAEVTPSVQGSVDQEQTLSTIFEECDGLLGAEVSTDAGATSGTSVASEAEDNAIPEGDDSPCSEE